MWLYRNSLLTLLLTVIVVGFALAQSPRGGDSVINGVCGGDLNGGYPTCLIAAVQGNPVNGSTGTDTVVFSTAPTMTGTPTINGHLKFTGGSPSVSSCGAGASVGANSNDARGFINVGTGLLTACTLNFSATYSTVPMCTVSPGGVSLTLGVTALTGSVMTVSSALTLAGATFYYTCFQ